MVVRRSNLSKNYVSAFIAGFVLLGCAREPTYDGHTLTYWLQENWLGGPEVERAFRAIGTNALPYLLRGIKNPNDPLPGPMTPEWKMQNPSVPPQLLIVRAFNTLGDLAEPLVPELTRLTEDKQAVVAESALSALAHMGPKGFRSLIAAAQNPNHPYRGRATFLMGETHFLGANAEPIAIELVKLMDDPAVNQAAAHALGELAIRPDITVPALAKVIQDTNTSANLRATAAISLESFEEKAALALPALTNALIDPDPQVRSYATNLISFIRNKELRQGRK